MAKEIEVKFKVAEFREIRKNLKKAGAKFLGRAFEKTTKFDTPSQALRRKKLWLRTRTGFKNTLTLKEKTGGKDKKFKAREEIELEVSDPRKMGVILDKLGLNYKLVMEKYREKWQFKQAEVVLDKLPFGNFIEIEGPMTAIEKTEKTLGLNPQKRITLTYWHFWEKIRKEKGIENKNITFRKN